VSKNKRKGVNSMSTKTTRKIKEVKQAVKANKKSTITRNEAVIINLTEPAEKSFVKKLARKHLIAKRREKELEEMKKIFLEEIVSKYVSEDDKREIAKFDENKYIELVSDSDSVRDNVQYDVTYDNDELLKIAKKRDVLSKVAKVSITKIRPFLEQGEEAKAIIEKVVSDKITVTKK
jgi:D-arabinose 1-dehydrogenase-like Zn-dependent alcohol dehydrogenase